MPMKPFRWSKRGETMFTKRDDDLFREKQGIWKIDADLVKKANADIEDERIKSEGSPVGDYTCEFSPTNNHSKKYCADALV